MDVDVALVLAVDCSSSVDTGDFRLQMKGIAEALRHPAVAEAIAAGEHKRIALALVQWSTGQSQHVSIDWRVLADPADIQEVMQDIEVIERHSAMGGTGLAAAISFCTSLLAQLPHVSSRHVIDVSGDGEENDGGDVEAMRSAAVAQGIVINGLPVLSGSHTIEAYYRRKVIGGPGAFVAPAKNLVSFAEVMARKLTREIGAQTV